MPKSIQNDARKEALARSWDDNAAKWTRAVRQGLIASRREATDAAIVEAVLRHNPKRLLDAGCGEGWLLRRLRQDSGCTAIGIDASEQLIAAARQADPNGDYRVLPYDRLRFDGAGLGAAFDAIVFNFALFDEELAPLLVDAAALLAPRGILVIQTLHPDLSPLAPSGDGWRGAGWHCEDFAAFAEPGWRPMPWFGRDRESWRAVIAEAGLELREHAEPRGAERPLSLLMTCGKPE